MKNELAEIKCFTFSENRVGTVLMSGTCKEKKEKQDVRITSFY